MYPNVRSSLIKGLAPCKCLLCARSGHWYSLIARERRTVHGGKTAASSMLKPGEVMTAQQAPRLETERLILK